MKLISVLTSLILISISVAQAQQLKIENEKEVKAEELPDAIKSEMSILLPQAKRVKYYEEKDGSNTFYEVKMKFNQKLLSIKFYESGELFDIEETVSFTELDLLIQEHINNYFKKNFKNHHIKKVQLNYTESEGTEDALQKYISHQLESLSLKYEIEAFIKSGADSKMVLNEFLFSSEGELLLRQKINSRATDYVSY